MKYMGRSDNLFISFKKSDKAYLMVNFQATEKTVKNISEIKH